MKEIRNAQLQSNYQKAHPMKAFLVSMLVLGSTSVFAGHPRCAGNPEPAKCEKLEAQLAAETPAQKEARRMKLERDRASSAQQVMNAPVAPSQPMTPGYSSSWREETNLQIARALVANKIGACGEYRYRTSKTHTDEFLVQCTRDGKNWLSYLVWTEIKKVTGPIDIDAIP